MLPQLEPTDDRARPAFRDVASCEKWLSQLQLTNLGLAQGTLRTQVDELNRCALPAKERLHILETLRETVATVQGDFAKKLFGKKLPLSDDDIAALISLTNLWQSMLKGYLRCIEDSRSSASAALPLLHRALLYSGLQLSEFLRAGCEPDARSWQRFHTIYAHIEEHGLQQEPVHDKHGTGRPVSCRTLYAKMLLLHRARLLGLSRSQWQIVDRWLEHWADSFTVEPRCTMSKGDAPPLAVDLAGTRGLVPVEQASTAASMRYLAMVPLSKLLRVKTILLQQGQSTQQLDLGSDLSSKDCIELLGKLHACWCEQRAESLADAPRDAPIVQLCTSIENVYAHISGKPFRTPSSAGTADKEAQKQIEAFGRVLDETDRQTLSQLGFLAEEWLAEEDGLLQARLLRKTTAGARLGLNQLVCVHKPDAATYKLGVTTAVSINRNGLLYISVRYLPGVPEALIVRGTPSGNLLSGATVALMLPEMASLRIPASLVMPRDWFQTGRPLELTVRDQPKKDVTLGMSVEKGNDYERMSFTAKR